MSRIKLIARKLLFAACLLLGAGNAHATDDPPYVTVFKGSMGQIVVDDALGTAAVFHENTDNVFYTPALNATILNPANDKITNAVSLLIDESMLNLIQTDFSAYVDIKIDYTLVDGTVGSVNNTRLSINYTKGAGLKYNARQTLKFDQCRKVKVTIIAVSPNNAGWNFWQVVNLENRMLCKRDYKFDYANAVLTPNPAGTIATDADELPVSWPTDPTIANGKTHIDIEWAWVDAEALDNYTTGGNLDADLIFKNNASRVTVSKEKSSYAIPLIYDGKGRLFYRIRPVQLRENEQVLNGEWSAKGTEGITFYERTLGHEENLNWQTTTSFAEEGKRKTVVQYFDGTLRGRQTVTKDNVTNKTVVAESFYDFQGRPAINILPAPTMNTVIKYTADFNKFVGNYATPKEVFDLMPTNVSPCNYETPRLDKTNPNGGSAQYYSDLNPQKEIGFNKFIPDADGYSYTETRYSPDATGRIEAQGGVGGIFQLGHGNGTADHDTKYFYGKPAQEELDGLFGTEAGDASHYSKNMVRDANGQYSVSYVDMHGRTIATALAGKAPANVKPIDSYSATAGVQHGIKKTLVTPSNNNVEGRSIVSSSTLLVTQEVPHQFHYELGPLSAEIQACKPKGETVCYDCYYNLEIRISGGCGVNIVKTANNLSFNTSGTPVYDQDCKTLPPPIIVDFTETLKEGEYNITKTLRVNKQAQDWYRDNVYNTKNLCKTFDDIYDSIYHAMLAQSSECSICSDCVPTATRAAAKGASSLKNTLSGFAKKEFPFGKFAVLNTNKSATPLSSISVARSEGDESNAVPPLINDECANAITLTVNADYNCGVFTTGFTTGSHITTDLPSCFGYMALPGDVWYKFTATGTSHRVTLYDITTMSHGGSFCMSVYSGTCAGFIELACTGYPFITDLTDLTPGAVYYVRIIGNSDGYSSFKVCVGTPHAVICPPPADSVCQSICGQSKNTLEAIRDLMMDDMSPDYGQYARLDVDLNGNQIYDPEYNTNYGRYEQSTIKDYNIFNPSYSPVRYKTPFDNTGAIIHNYFDDNGNIDPNGDEAALTAMTPEIFSDRFDPVWAKQLLPYHPEYCKLTTAEQYLQESYRRDALIEETDTWYDAETAGYINDSNHPGDGTGILYQDPFFNCVGSDSLSLMAQYINSNFNAYQAGPPFLSFWKIAWMTVFCDEHTSIPAPSLPPGSCEAGAPLRPGLFSPAFFSGCAADRDAVWRIYRTLYLSEKERFVNEWLQQMCPVDYTNIDGAGGNHYERRFGKPDEYYSSSIYLQHLIANATTDNGPTAVNHDMGEEYDANCESYKIAWAARLRQCDVIRNLDQPVIINSNGEEFTPNPFIDALLIKLKNVCIAGSDEDHLMGSSTVAPGSLVVPASFQAAFDAQWVSSFGPQTVFCNRDLIDFPQPYDKQSPISGESITEQKDECVCTRLAELNAEMAADAVFMGSAATHNLSTYLSYKHGTIIRQTLIDSLMAGCASTGCINYEFPVEIPPILSCDNPINNSVDCDVFHTLVDQFKVMYPTVSNNVIYEDPANDEQLAANKALAAFINNRTGLTKTWADYLFFKRQCDLLATCRGACPPPILCRDVMFPDVQVKDSCNQYVATMALNAAIEMYQLYLIHQQDIFENTYLNKCLEAKDREKFTVQAILTQSDPPDEYHYTLYYYDQAGSLVKTVPPEGVRAVFTQSHFDAVSAARSAGTDLRINHYLPTQYRYNTLGQVIAQSSPDGGTSSFWYDDMGRLVVSQNAKQRGLFTQRRRYSYTKYDIFGRIIEVGEKTKTGSFMTQQTAQGLNPDVSLAGWLAPTSSEPLSSITKTKYDVTYEPVCTDALLCQQNLRNRVSYSYVQKLDDGTDPGTAPWESATFYTYDIHGNVDVLLQDYKATMGLIPGNRFKKITYKYDLISGKVNEVAYQPGQADAFYHRYKYDAENKLTEAQTSKEYVYWESDAAYSYYRHGPLARTVLGALDVQGVDYAYTLQGWLKGVNSTGLSRETTIGNGEDCGDHSAVNDLHVYTRPNYTPFYLARRSITFEPNDFTSLIPDNFVASIDPTLAGCGTDGTAGTQVINGENNAPFDMGQDGKTDANGQPVITTNPSIYGNNTRVPDAYGYSLNYYNGDYNRINGAAANPFAAINMHIPTGDAANPYSAEQLFNGNIGAMVVSIPKLGRANVYGYNYDQLNRIRNMQAFTGVSNTTNAFTPVATDDYKEAVTYDANGNIKTYLRNGTSAPTQYGPGNVAMDQLAYKYYYVDQSNAKKQYDPTQPLPADLKSLTNQLAAVKDAVADANYPTDIDNQADENYAYDAIGNLIKDTKEGITNIEWTVYGKISKINKTKPDGTNIVILYTYDAAGNRITKSYSEGGATAVVTYYVRDASGNVMSVYDNDYGQKKALDGSLFQKEIHLYGSSRIGVYNVNVQMHSESRIFITMAGTTGNHAEQFTFARGNKSYELSNHLGNVLVTVSDKKLTDIIYCNPAIDKNCQQGTVVGVYYKADVLTANDYYPFGMQMPGRKFSINGDYRYGFNGKEGDNSTGEGNLDFGARIMDSRLGKWLSVDPLQKKYPSFSPYNFVANNPVIFVDKDGRDFIIFVRTNVNQQINTTYDQFTGGTYTDKGGHNSFSEMQYVVIKAPGTDRFFYQVNERKEEISNHYDCSICGASANLIASDTKVIDFKKGATNEFFPIWNATNPYPAEDQVNGRNLRYNTLSITSTSFDLLLFKLDYKEGDYIQLAKLSTPALKKALNAKNSLLYSDLQTYQSEYEMGMLGLEIYSLTVPILDGISPSVLNEARAARGELQSFSGTEKARQTGATPNSRYTYLSSDGKAVSNYIYDAEGKVIYQVDFGQHGQFSSGHGHKMEVPGSLGSGHTSHIPSSQVPAEYLQIPGGVEYSIPPTP